MENNVVSQKMKSIKETTEQISKKKEKKLETHENIALIMLDNLTCTKFVYISKAQRMFALWQRERSP